MNAGSVMPRRAPALLALLLILASFSDYPCWQIAVADQLPGAEGQQRQEAIANLIQSIQQAVRDENFKKAESLKAQLVRYGTNVVAAIRDAIDDPDSTGKMTLVGALFHIRGDAASDALLTLAVNDVDADVASVAAGMLDKRSIPRALSSEELARGVARMQDAKTRQGAWWASLLARVRDAQPSDAEIRTGAILDRFEAESALSPTNFVVGGDYLSADAMRLNAYLLTFPHLPSDTSVPMVKGRYDQAANPRVKKWLLLARGMCGEETAGRDLRQFALDTEQDVSERALALRAYMMAVGTNAVPLLERFLDDYEVGHIPGLPPDEPGTINVAYPLRVIARGELHWLKNPEQRMKYRGY